MLVHAWGKKRELDAPFLSQLESHTHFHTVHGHYDFNTKPHGAPQHTICMHAPNTNVVACGGAIKP
jgi:hypothetical protein